jgi:sn-glycerol 3-phosphate transport system substrate-binding protein
MPRTRKQWLLAGATLALLTVTAACGSGPSPTGTAAAPGPSALTGAPVTVTFWHGLGGPAGEALQQAVDRFNSTNPDHITVQPVFQGNYQDTLAKYTAAVRDGSTPDVLLTNDVSTGFLHDAGQTIAAQDLAAANPGDLNLNDLRPAARNYYSVAGKLLSVPFNTSMPMLFVNDALLTRAGVDKADLSTVDGMAAAAREVHTTEPGVFGFTNPQADGWWFEQLTAAAGEPYCTPENGRNGENATALSLNGPAQHAALQTLTSLYTDGVAFNPGANGDAVTAAFTSGKVAMMLNSSGVIGNLAAANMTGYTALPLPLAAAKGTGGPLIGGASLWVDGPGHDPAHQLASWKLITYLLSPQVQEQFSQASGYAPVNTKVDASPSQQQYLQKNQAEVAVIGQFNNAAATTATAGCLTGALPTVRAEVLSAMDSAITGRTTLDAAITQAQDRATASIKDYNAKVGK